LNDPLVEVAANAVVDSILKALKSISTLSKILTSFFI